MPSTEVTESRDGTILTVDHTADLYRHAFVHEGVQPPLEVGPVPNEFWDDCTVTWTVNPGPNSGNQYSLRLFAIGGFTLWSATPAMTGGGSDRLDNPGGYPNSFDLAGMFEPWSTLDIGTGGMYFDFIWSEGEPLPPDLTITVTGSYDITFITGQDVAPTFDYHMQTALGDDVSTWTASGDLYSAHDTPYGASGVALAGIDYDADGVDDTQGLSFWHLTAYQYAPVLEIEARLDITRRRFT